MRRSLEEVLHEAAFVRLQLGDVGVVAWRQLTPAEDVATYDEYIAYMNSSQVAMQRLANKFQEFIDHVRDRLAPAIDAAIEGIAAFNAALTPTKQ